MNALRLRVIFLVGWLVIFLGAEPILSPVHLNGEAAALALGIVAVVLGGPALGFKAPIWATLLAIGPALVVWEWLDGSLIEKGQIPLVVMESSALAVTAILAYWSARSLGEFETAVSHIMVGRRERVPAAEEPGSGSLYREVRRARNHGRPLALLSIAVDEQSIQANLDRLIQKAQSVMMKQYALAGVSKLLCDKLEDCDVVVESDGGFLAALPETTPDDLPHLLARLRSRVAEEVGVELKIGVAFLPNDGFTLEGLVQKATEDMHSEAAPVALTSVQAAMQAKTQPTRRAESKPDLFIDLNKLPVERNR